jgi:hypothetical protein
VSARIETGTKRNLSIAAKADALKDQIEAGSIPVSLSPAEPRPTLSAEAALGTFQRLSGEPNTTSIEITATKGTTSALALIAPQPIC